MLETLTADQFSNLTDSTFRVSSADGPAIAEIRGEAMEGIEAAGPQNFIIARYNFMGIQINGHQGPLVPTVKQTFSLDGLMYLITTAGLFRLDNPASGASPVRLVASIPGRHAFRLNHFVWDGQMWCLDNGQLFRVDVSGNTAEYVEVATVDYDPPMAPGVAILATSRERLHLKGEEPIPVEGLQVPEQDHLESEHRETDQDVACELRPDQNSSRC
jgi:hypothetical protein